jgi:hypothetical protein
MCKEKNVSDVEEAQRILILDLASDNPVDMQIVESLLQSSSNRRTYRVTEFGAIPSSEGGAADPHAWRTWTDAVDRMLMRLREELGGDGGIAHYYVAGRAGLPIFAHLGVRLGKQARITAINQRPSGEWDVVPFQKPRPISDTASTIGFRAPAAGASGPSGGRFFEVVKGLDRESSATGRVAVFVSTQRDLEAEKIRSFARKLDVPLADIVTIRARPPEPGMTTRRWLSGSDGPRAAAELEEYFTAIKDCYPYNEGLIVFLAGPVSLGLMAGWAINPRIYTPVWLPYFRKNEYEPAVEIPWPLVSGGKPRILIATANPADDEGGHLDIERELRGMLKHLDEVSGPGCEYRFCMAARVGDLMEKLEGFQPHILHFSGHGEKGGCVFRRDNGDEHFVPMAALTDMIRSTARELRLAVFCSCQSTWQAEALTDLADCTIGTNANVLDEAAIAFSAQFYAALTRGSPVKRAFEQGRARAAAEAQDSTCEFHLHVRDGVDASQVIIFSPSESAS